MKTYYRGDAKALKAEVTQLALLGHAASDIGVLMRRCTHHAALQSLGQAYTAACQAEVTLREHLEYYLGRQEEGGWPVLMEEGE